MIAIRFFEIDFYTATHAHRPKLLLFLWRNLDQYRPHTKHTWIYISENIAISTGTQLQILHEEQEPPPTWPIVGGLSYSLEREEQVLPGSHLHSSQLINGAWFSLKADLLFEKSRSLSGSRGLSYWRFILKLGSSGEGDWTGNYLHCTPG